jgi:hypothetical protein
LSFTHATQLKVERPYRIPIPDWAAVLLVIPPSLGILVLFTIASWSTYIFVFFVFILGIAFHYLQQLSKRKGWCIFMNMEEGRYSHTPQQKNSPEYFFDAEEVIVTGKNENAMSHEEII